jgi:NAD(P)-dependent dehydrogenase (short-subunit alcohol dehydrogenase family)
MKLENKNAIVTGGSLGLGQAIVREFVKEGASVLFCARGEAALDELQRDLARHVRPEQKISALPCDVTSAKEVAALFERFASEFGTLHALVNNAGIYGPKGPSENVDWHEWTRAMEINLYGTFLPCRAAIPLMKKTGHGKIINLSGGGATNPLPRLSAYAASKAAVVRLTETLAEELRDFHIDINAIAPGPLNTRLLDEVLEAGPEKVGETFFKKMRRQAEEGGVRLEKGARLCVYLASDASDGITGKLISAQWDPWENLHERRAEIATSDIYTLRRIVPKDRAKNWG